MAGILPSADRSKNTTSKLVKVALFDASLALADRGFDFCGIFKTSFERKAQFDEMLDLELNSRSCSGDERFLIAHGAVDNVISLNDSKTLVERNPKLRLIICEGDGHSLKKLQANGGMIQLIEALFLESKTHQDP